MYTSNKFLKNMFLIKTREANRNAELVRYLNLFFVKVINVLTYFMK